DDPTSGIVIGSATVAVSGRKQSGMRIGTLACIVTASVAQTSTGAPAATQMWTDGGTRTIGICVTEIVSRKNAKSGIG
ncbi:hypothetical protein NP565_24715, partial [Vibrio parahaemolyticus]|nr:hypothetical protein [Vibrio parahaemolyticus]